MSHDSPSHRPQALALRYEPKDGAPRVVAKGYGTLAEKIVETAREHGLYVHESPELVGLLMQVDLDRHIPLSSIKPWLNCWPGSTPWNKAIPRPHKPCRLCTTPQKLEPAIYKG